LFDSTASTCATQCSSACDVEMAAGSVCAGEKLPSGVQRGIEKSHELLVRSAKETDPAKIARLTARAMRRLDDTTRVAAHAERNGKLSLDCSRAIAAMVGEAGMQLSGQTP